MEATFRAKRALFNISKLLPKCPSPITIRASLSTSPPGSSAAVRESTYDANRQPIRTAESDRSTAEDTAKDGIKKVVEMAENVAKETVDGAWKAAEDTSKVVKESASGNDDEAVDDEVNTNSIEELRAKAGGYDKAGPTN
ncbi:hypothetical protein V6N13_142450 [Hibiscus sabdariffa]|uniref:Uncharacterized protein n=1 Tax=Hibiscus sabdariffa TaxID=183260 RepID=A0ABR2FEK7_9ROSI